MFNVSTTDSVIIICFCHTDDVKLMFKGSSSYLYNHKTGNKPLVVHGNGPIKVSGGINYEFKSTMCSVQGLESA